VKHSDREAQGHSSLWNAHLYAFEEAKDSMTTSQTTTTTVLGEATIQELKTGLRGEVIRPGDEGYDAARKVWNGMIDKHPALIVRCAGVADVIAAVQFARSQHLLVAVRGGGHNVTGNATCDGGLVIDLSRMKGMRVDPEARTVRAQAGLTWGEFDHETQAFGLATTGGLVSTTGVAGFTTGGGIGWLVRKHGLACDNVLAVDVVTADGRLLTANRKQNADLYWAVRGGGGNFGVVTSFEFQLYPVGNVLGGLVLYPAAQAGEVLRFYREFVTTAPDELTTIAAFLTAPPAPFVPPAMQGTPAFAVIACYAGPVEKGERVLRPLRSFGSPAVDLFHPMPYTVLQALFDEGAPAGLQNYWKAHYLKGLSDDAIETLVSHAVGMRSPLTQIHVHHLGGAMKRVASGATAFPYRDGQYILNLIASWTDPTENEQHIQWVRDSWQAMVPYATGGAYLNFMGEEGDERVRAAYAGNYKRLAALKRQYDPTNFFRLNQNVPPAE
jgi:FAD/FMN-containing dehydrogenase